MEGKLAGVENACCLDAGMGLFRTQRQSGSQILNDIFARGF
jgi:hypothetical protein